MAVGHLAEGYGMSWGLGKQVTNGDNWDWYMAYSRGLLTYLLSPHDPLSIWTLYRDQGPHFSLRAGKFRVSCCGVFTSKQPAESNARATLCSRGA